MNTARRKELNQERGQTLLPELWQELEVVLDALEANGWYPFITQAYRSLEEQTAIYAQGREDLDTVNNLRKIAGLDIIADEENKIVTHAKSGSSKHNFRRAVDLANYKDGESCDFDNLYFYNAVWGYLERKGWLWGHKFQSFDDVAHYEK